MPLQHRGDRYGASHRQQRRAWMPLVLAGQVMCSRCHQLIGPGEPWDLDHLDEVREHPAHRACNRAAGAANRNRIHAHNRTTREW